jgi:CRP-like cAMP-binding protein
LPQNLVPETTGEDMSTDCTLAQELSSFCGHRSYREGEVLRQKGQHYRDMYIVLEGCALVRLDGASEGTQVKYIYADEPVGEICFLQGTAAIATVTAKSDLKVLKIDDLELANISEQRPELVARLLQDLARTASARLSYNLSVTDDTEISADASAIEILLCRSDDQLNQAKRLRYDVYCNELKRNSPNADHQQCVISDALDGTGYCFIAEKQGKTIGTLRANYAGDGPLNGLETIYGMTRSQHFPGKCGVCTKFIVDRSNRGGPAAMMLIAHAVQLGMRDDMQECYIDCIPDLIDYYSALGFSATAPEFFHPENGLSLPMKLDLNLHGTQMSGREGLRHMIRLFLKTRANKRQLKQ